MSKLRHHAINQFNKQPDWTEVQAKVLNSKPNILVSGCAGSGKSLLACHIAMRNSMDKKVAILVFTKSLRTFIKDYINSFGDNDITVMYEFEWRLHDFPKFDIIIVDEFQDFSANDILNTISCSSVGVYLFGDNEQKIYDKNLRDNPEPTISLKELIILTNFEHIQLVENFRISEENKNFISSVFKDNSLKISKFSTSIKPQIRHFENVKDELNWMIDFLLSNSEFKNIGILLKQNDGFKGAYNYRGHMRKDKIYGILELRKYFEENGIDCAYKYKSNDNLNFSNEININLMTYASSKGLQFDCVILPFSNYVNENNGKVNLPYVGLTRATKQIIITYSGIIAEEYSVPFAKSVFEGQIVRKTKKDQPNYIQSIELEIIRQLKEKPGFEHLKKGFNKWTYPIVKL